MPELHDSTKQEIAIHMIKAVVRDIEFGDISARAEDQWFALNRNDLLDIARLIWEADIDVTFRTDD